jgi:type 1 fimbria pilin
MNVDIGTIKRADLKGVGTWAGGTPFDIKLECSGESVSVVMQILTPHFLEH